jgi:hypothetical protein
MVLMMFAVSGCGKDHDVTSEDSGECNASNTGFTECGSFNTDECQPGQYCGDATYGDCYVGCTSDVNCASNQFCDLSDGTGLGTCAQCENNTTGDVDKDTEEDQGSLLDGCLDACDAAQQECGAFDAMEVTQCKEACRNVSSDYQQAFMDCVDASLADNCEDMDFCGG